MSLNRSILHKIYPQNTKTSYGEYDIVDFVMAFPGRKMVGNSVRVQGNVTINSIGSTQKVLTDEIMFDKWVGANSMFDAITTRTDLLGNLEVVQFQPRLNKMIATGFETENDLCDSHNVVQLKCATNALMNDILNGIKPNGKVMEDPNTNDPTSFSIKPEFILNRVVPLVPGGDVNVQSSKTGNIYVSLRLTRNLGALWGAQATANANYEITNLAITFLSVPDNGKQMPIKMYSTTAVRQSIQSSFGAFSANVNGLIEGVSFSFLTTANENVAYKNNLDLEHVPDISSVEFLINDNINEYLSFPLTTYEEILKYYLESLGSGGYNSATLQNLKNNHVFGIGLKFSSPLDLSNKKFGMNLNSGIATAGGPVSMVAYAMFHGSIVIA